MIILRFFPALVLSAFLWAHSAIAAGTSEGPYPVWWEPVIEYAAEHGYAFEKLEDAERLLTTPFHGGMWVNRKDEPQESGFEIHDCATYRRIAEQGGHEIYVGVGNYDLEVNYLLSRFGVYCQALEQLSHVIPAKKSFLQDFVLDEKALDYLPAFVDASELREFRCRAYFANQRGTPLTRFWRYTGSKPYDKIEMTGGTRIKLAYSGLKYDTGVKWMILARGDFNNDGLEDLLIHIDAFSYRTGYTELLVVTRDAPNSVLYVLDAERHIRHLHDGRGCGRPGLFWGKLLDQN